MTDAGTGACLVYNGEIYNCPELRRYLISRGVNFRSHGDTEVILQLYITDGAQGLSRLRGMYAFVIWDPRSQHLVAARDPFGIKPLYIWADGSRIVFSSQVRALECGLPAAPLVADALIEYGLFGHVFSRQTPVQGVEEVGPGEILCFDRSGRRPSPARVDVRQLFELAAPEALELSEIAAALEETVAAHMLSDVPIGVLLSAGTDSTVVASRLAAAADPSLVTTFTIGFQGVGLEVEDEAPRAALIAKALNFPNLSEAITPDVIEETLDDYFHAMDQPTVDGVNTYFAARLVRRHGVKVALVGTGGDELFGGYPSFQRIPFAISRGGRAGILIAAAAAKVGLASSSFNADKLSWLKDAGRTLTGTYLVLRGLMDPEQVARAYGCEIRQVQAVFERVHETLHQEARGIPDTWSAVSYLETRFYLMPRLLRDADWAGMAHSVEIRTPLVDWVLWRRVRALIAEEQRRRPRTKRELMSPALAPGVSAVIPKAKLGFGNPYSQLAQMAGDRRIVTQGRAASQQQWAAHVLERWSSACRTSQTPNGSKGYSAAPQ